MGNSDGKLAEDVGSVHKTIVHFEHSFPANLIAYTVENQLELPGQEGQRGNLELGKGRAVYSMVRTDRISEETVAEIEYSMIKEVVWDHTLGGVRVDFKTLRNMSASLMLDLGTKSIEVEENIQLRCKVESGGSSDKLPFKCQYMGMCAGATKPKPFQRKRPNLSDIPQGRLPTLMMMRTTALAARGGTERTIALSRRQDLLKEAIYCGRHSFALLSCTENGVKVPAQPSQLILTYEAVELSGREVPNVETLGNIRGQQSPCDQSSMKFSHQSIHYWDLPEVESASMDAALRLVMYRGSTIQLMVRVEDAWYVRQALEFFYNRNRRQTGEPPKPGSKHGRRVKTKHTLQGDTEVTDEETVGVQTVFDDKGSVVYSPQSNQNFAAPISPSNRHRMRETFGSSSGKKSLGNSMRVVLSRGSSKRKSLERAEDGSGMAGTRSGRWNLQVVHNGWLWKKTIGSTGPKKSWSRRYFVLYSVPVGHFLVYYADSSHSPLFSDKRMERQVIDLSKVTFIRPRASKKNTSRTHAFDLITVEREWTLAAENEETTQRWLFFITQCVDEDVAVVPDDELVFQGKMRLESSPLSVKNVVDMNKMKTPTLQITMKVSASGMEISGRDEKTTVEMAIEEHEVLSSRKAICSSSHRQFWCYTDFFKWSIVHTKGKKDTPRGLMVHVFTDTSFTNKNIYFLKTPAAAQLATAIEFHIEKFMARMHLSKEIELAKTGSPRGSPRGSALERTDSASIASHRNNEDASVASRKGRNNDAASVGSRKGSRDKFSINSPRGNWDNDEASVGSRKSRNNDDLSIGSRKGSRDRFSTNSHRGNWNGSFRSLGRQGSSLKQRIDEELDILDNDSPISDLEDFSNEDDESSLEDKTIATLDLLEFDNLNFHPNAQLKKISPRTSRSASYEQPSQHPPPPPFQSQGLPLSRVTNSDPQLHQMQGRRMSRGKTLPTSNGASNPFARSSLPNPTSPRSPRSQQGNMQNGVQSTASHNSADNFWANNHPLYTSRQGFSQIDPTSPQSVPLNASLISNPFDVQNSSLMGNEAPMSPSSNPFNDSSLNKADPFDPFDFLASQQEPNDIQMPSEELLNFWYEALLPAPSEGCLFENNVLQIWWRHEYRGSQGSATITCTNKSLTASITGLSIELAKTGSHLRCTVGDASYSANNGSFQINPGSNASLPIRCQLMAPFSEPPRLALGYLVGNQAFTHSVKVPLLLTHFMEPVHFNRATFSQKWSGLGRISGQSIQEVVNSQKKPDSAECAKLLQTVLHLACVMDSGISFDRLIAASGTLRTEARSASGDKISIGCLVRLEFEHQAKIRLTIRTAHPAVTKSLVACVKQNIFFRDSQVKFS